MSWVLCIEIAYFMYSVESLARIWTMWYDFDQHKDTNTATMICGNNYSITANDEM